MRSCHPAGTQTHTQGLQWAGMATRNLPLPLSETDTASWAAALLQEAQAGSQPDLGKAESWLLGARSSPSPPIPFSPKPHFLMGCTLFLRELGSHRHFLMGIPNGQRWLRPGADPHASRCPWGPAFGLALSYPRSTTLQGPAQVPLHCRPPPCSALVSFPPAVSTAQDGEGLSRK